MRVSINITNFSWSTRHRGLAEHLIGVLRAAEAAGLHTVWVGDHLLQADPTSHRDAEMLEAYTTLGFIAAHTQRVQIGTMPGAGRAWLRGTYARRGGNAGAVGTLRSCYRRRAVPCPRSARSAAAPPICSVGCTPSLARRVPGCSRSPGC